MALGFPSNISCNLAKRLQWTWWKSLALWVVIDLRTWVLPGRNGPGLDYLSLATLPRQWIQYRNHQQVQHIHCLYACISQAGASCKLILQLVVVSQPLCLGLAWCTDNFKFHDTLSLLLYVQPPRIHYWTVLPAVLWPDLRDRNVPISLVLMLMVA